MSVLLAFDDDGTPFRLAYQLAWDDARRLLRAELEAWKGRRTRTLVLRSDGEGRWQGGHGERLHHLDGCIDIDIWPTPLTNSFPLWRSSPMQIGERLEFRMAWVSAPDLSMEAKPQAYTRLDENRFLFESLDGSGFKAELAVDHDQLVMDYPGLFLRV